jgi:hypothetical protein
VSSDARPLADSAILEELTVFWNALLTASVWRTCRDKGFKFASRLADDERPARDWFLRRTQRYPRAKELAVFLMVATQL